MRPTDIWNHPLGNMSAKDLFELLRDDPNQFEYRQRADHFHMRDSMNQFHLEESSMVKFFFEEVADDPDTTFDVEAFNSDPLGYTQTFQPFSGQDMLILAYHAEFLLMHGIDTYQPDLYIEVLATAIKRKPRMLGLIMMSIHPSFLMEEREYFVELLDGVDFTG